MSERAIEAAALEYATNLAKAIARKHFPDVPQWEPLDDLMGVLSQIDNMTTGMVRPAALAEDDAAVEKIKEAMLKERDNMTAVYGKDASMFDLPTLYARAAIRAMGGE